MVEKTNEQSGTLIVEANHIRQARSLVTSLTEKLAEKRKALAQGTKRLREAEMLIKKHEKNERRKGRTRIVAHAGGMMEMTGLLECRFIDSSERDNVQDNLRANLLVGALLKLAHQLSEASAEELQSLTARGKQYRELRPAVRVVPKVNPLIILGEIADDS